MLWKTGPALPVVYNVIFFSPYGAYIMNYKDICQEKWLIGSTLQIQSTNWIEIYSPFTTLHPCFQPNMLLKVPAEKRCLKAVCAACLIVWWRGGFSKLLLSCSGCIGRSVCLFSETLFLYWASIVMCVADGDTNFRLLNNRTDNLFPVYIVLGSLQPDKSTHTYTLHFSSNWLLRIMPNPHKDIFGFKLLLHGFLHNFLLCLLDSIYWLGC